MHGGNIGDYRKSWVKYFSPPLTRPVPETDTMKLFPHLVFLLPYLVFGWTPSQSPFSHCQIKHFIFNLSKISILHRRRMSLWVFLCQSWELAVGSLFRASHKVGWPFIFMDKLVGLGKQEWGYLWDEHNCSTAIHKRGGRIWCLRSNLGSLEQGEEKGEEMQETNFVMCSVILFLNPQDYQQDLCNWVILKLRRRKAECHPWSLWHRTVATNAKETEGWLRKLESMRKFRN